jgi:GNAT superfamily N-acetyltransferase
LNQPTIRLATTADVAAFFPAVRTLVAAMNDTGNDQWADGYPTVDHFLADAHAGSLFVDDENGTLRGLVTLDTREPAEYADRPWSVGRPALNVHRLAVLPGFQRRGVADGLLAFAEARAVSLGLDLKSDTAVVNGAMNALFSKRGWTRIGTLNFSDATVDFCAWEKASLQKP